MDRNPISNEADYTTYLKGKYNIPDHSKWVSHERLDFNIDTDILLLETFNKLNIETIEKSQRINNLLKPHHIKVHKQRKLNYSFKDCEFHENFMLLYPEDGNFIFENCTFHKMFSMSDAKFSGKFKFYSCTFYNARFRNTTFQDLADFFNCTFKNQTIFYKTDFKGITVFSASTFEKSVLFTYTLIEKLIVFRGTRFEKGLDLSLAIISGELNPFNIRLKRFRSKKITLYKVFSYSKNYSWKNYREKYEKIYDNYVSKEGKIPIQNKIETYRILKQSFIKRDDIAKSIDFKVREKETLFIELIYANILINSFNIITLLLNYISNRFGKSYINALFFICIFGGTFFYLSATNAIVNDLDSELSIDLFNSHFGYFLQFILPTHKLNYMGNENLSSTYFILYDFIGRIFVSYGIYQFIQAFRKYR